MTEKISLLICQTPLQALVAEKIIEINPHKKFFPVYTAYEWNAKHENYAARLVEKCGRGIKKEIANLKQISELAKQVLELEFNEIYLASIDAPLSLVVLSGKENLDVYTYDDGSANITPKSFYFRKNKNPVTYPGLNITWDKFKVREKSKKHYTIFDSDFNIVPSSKLERLDLFNFEKEESRQGKEVSVLLGQMIMNPGQNEMLMNKIMQENNIDYFFPHPREGVLESLRDKTIETKLIFEEYYLELLKDYDVINIYHFYSTVAFNLRKHPRINEKILDKDFYESWYFSL
ncbi:MAG: glycosyltransferase family 52 [Gemella sp.]|nr:glycosyltransferase family 52 [Gemella sp.]